MRLLFVLWNHGLGGAEVFTRALCAELARTDGYEMHILVLTPEGPLALGPHPPGVFVTTGRSASAGDAVARTSGLRDTFSRLAPDCVFLSAYDAALPVIRRAGYRGPVCVVEHGGVILNPKLRPRARYWTQMAARRALSSRVQAEVAVSRFMYGVQTRLPHAPALWLVPNGVDTRRFAPAVRETGGAPAPPPADGAARVVRMGAAGTLIGVKGFGLLIDAADQLLRSGHRVEVSIAGDGPDRDRLQAIISRRGLDHAVRLLGRVADTPSFYRRQDVVVVPSTSASVESFNLVAVEAQACGVPVVASRVGALSEVVVDGRTGMVCTPDSPASLAAGLARYASDPALRVAHGSAARERVVRRYSLAQAADGYARVARAALSSSRST